MLTLKKSITITGTSTIDGTVVENFRAQIENDAPENMSFVPQPPSNKTLYKENRETCRADREKFEEYVYALQDEMIAAQETEEE